MQLYSVKIMLLFKIHIYHIHNIYTQNHNYKDGRVKNKILEIMNL